MKKHRCGRWLALICTVSAIASCALPADTGPKTLEGVPSDLLEPAPPATTTTSILVPTRAFDLYYFADDVLVRVARQLPSSSNAADVLNSLVSGTTQEGARSLIPTGVVVSEVRVDPTSRTATVVLTDDALFAVEGTDLTRAVAQIVFTATHLTGISKVRFEIDGSIRSVPTGPDPETSEPVGQCDYQRFDLSLSCPTTTQPE